MTRIVWTCAIPLTPQRRLRTLYTASGRLFISRSTHRSMLVMIHAKHPEPGQSTCARIYVSNDKNGQQSVAHSLNDFQHKLSRRTTKSSALRKSLRRVIISFIKLTATRHVALLVGEIYLSANAQLVLLSFIVFGCFLITQW